jgi:catechol 2,3-dioxygenase-like lactoylglutathione lyase family enzyme
MLHHVSIGVADVERAAKFYDAALAVLGYKRVMEFLPYAVAYGVKSPQFWVQIPHDRNTASVGNGVHIAFNAANKNAVHAFHRAALGAGGTDDGPPGHRPDYSPQYYGAFVRDLDGNKLEAMLMLMAAKPKTKAKAKAKTKKAKRGKKKSAKKTRKSKRR